MSAMEWLDRGGGVMWVLAALSVYVLGVILFKLWQFFSEQVVVQPSIDEAMSHIKKKKMGEAKDVLALDNHPLARMMLISVECAEDTSMSRHDKESEISRAGSVELHHLESHMRGLEMAGAIAPLLGLLGTVIGLIDSFSKLGIGSVRVDPSMLAGGIWSALLTTAAGLIIAIPALAAHSAFESMLERLRVRMHDMSTQILTRSGLGKTAQPSQVPADSNKTDAPSKAYADMGDTDEKVA